MASSGKSEKLGLSLWEASDKPERLDFRQDNEKLEELVGPHLNDYFLHLTKKEKDFVRNPIYWTWYQGNGNPTRTVTNYSNFPSEGKAGRLMVIFPIGTAPVVYRDGKTCLYFALASGMGNYHSAGLEVKDGNYTVFQQSAEEEGEYRCCLNEQGKSYFVFMLQ